MYGGNSTNFALPDLRVDQANINGRFIRARFNDTVTTQDDAIRSINTLDTSTGSPYYWTTGDAPVPPFYKKKETASYRPVSGYDVIGRFESMGFNPNLGTSTQNPMAGHAAGDDIHPYNISMIPIIIVS